MQHAREEYAGGSGRGAAGATPASVVVQTGEAGGSPQTLAADPNGVACWKNDENLPAVLRQGFEFYRSIGSKSARITSLAVTELDETHSMVKARWEMLFHKTGGELESIADEVFYLVQTTDGQPRIFSFITPDEKEIFRKRGLIRSA